MQHTRQTHSRDSTVTLSSEGEHFLGLYLFVIQAMRYEGFVCVSVCVCGISIQRCWLLGRRLGHAYSFAVS